MIPPPVLHRLGQLSRRKTAREFAAAAADPAAAQLVRLRAELSANADTVFGRQHGFGKIRTAAEYADAVPLMTPDDLQTWMRRVVEGERNLLTAEAPFAYVTTTGSTGPAKYVPITAAYKAEFQQTVHVAVWHLYRRFTPAFRGRLLYFVGSRRVRTAPDGLDIGAMSGLNFTEMPAVIRALYAWPYALFEVPDLATRTYLALHLAVIRDVTLIAGVFPAPIVYLLRDLEALAGELAHHVRRGTLPDRLVLTTEQRAYFAKLARPRPDIADRLARIPANPADAVALALPRLHLVYCWMTSTAGLFVPELKRRLGPRVHVRDAIYAACEGWCSIPMGDDAPGGALAVTSHFFEFIPEADYEAGRTNTLTAEQLEDGGRYYIVITNAGGMYRYVLGDLVEVRGFHQRTPRIVFVRKAGAASDLCGEKLEESHVNDAIARALGEVTWFSLVAVPGETLGYDLYLEGDADADAVDQALRDAAAGYNFTRAGGLLRPVRIRSVAPGTYHAWRQQAVVAGAAEAQLKTAHLLSSVDQLPEALRG